MRFEHLDLNLLVALDILLEERNITRTSERLNMTQSATSGVLRRLRTFFEDELLVQVGRKMQPTPYALDLQAPVREVMLKIRSTIITKHTLDPANSQRHFRVISADFVVTVLLSKVLQNIQHIAPGITFEIIPPSENSEPSLIRGEVDMIIVPERYIIEGHPALQIFEEDHVCAIWEENQLIGESLTFEEYIEMGHVSVGFGRNRNLSIEDWFVKQYDVSRRLEAISSDFNTLPQLVIGTNRIATMHKRLAEYYAKLLPLRIVPTPVKLPILKEYLQWHRAMENDPIHRWVREQIQLVANTLA